MDVRIAKLVKILSSDNRYWCKESINQICDILKSDINLCGSVLDAVRRGIIEVETSSWDARISAGECVQKIFSVVYVELRAEVHPPTAAGFQFESSNQLSFDLNFVIRNGAVLGAGKLGDSFDAPSSDFSGRSARLQLNRHLELDPSLGISSEQFVTDAELIEKSIENEDPKPAKLAKLHHNTADSPDGRLLRPGLEGLLASAAVGLFDALEAFERLMVDDLSSAAWTVRHGAALALKAVLLGSAHQRPLERHLSAVLSCIACDFFNDFVDGNSVVAPVRETCAQLVALILARCQDCDAIQTVLNAVRTFLAPVDSSLARYRWKYIHSGLLLAKYILPTICLQMSNSRLQPALGCLLEDVCSCLQHQNEDLIQVCCDSLDCCLSDLYASYPLLNSRLFDVTWSRLSDDRYDPLLDDWAVALLRMASKLVSHRSMEPRPLDPLKLSILCSFMTRGISSQAFQAAAHILLNAVGHFGVKDWTESGILHVMRCLFLRRLVSDTSNVAENQLNAKLWTSLLGQRPLDLVLKPVAPFFSQWFCSSIVTDNYPAINLALLLSDQQHQITDQSVFMASLTGHTQGAESADVLARARMDTAQYLAHFALELHANKITGWWTDENSATWLQECLLTHAKSDSATERSFLYMVLLQWLKLTDAAKISEDEFPWVAFEEVLSVDRMLTGGQMFVEVVPLLTEFNKAKKTLSHQLSNFGALPQPAADLLDQICVDFEQAELFLERWNEITPIFSQSLPVNFRNSLAENLEAFEKSSADLMQGMRRFGCCPLAWLACCQVADRSRPVPPKINALIAALMRVVKCSSSTSQPLSNAVASAVHTLLRRLIAERRTNVADKLIKNLVFLNASTFLNLLMKLKDDDEKEIIFDWELRINAFARENLSACLPVVNQLSSSACQNIAGCVLRLICQDTSEHLHATYPVIFDLLKNSCEPSSSNHQTIVGLSLLEHVLPALEDSTAAQILELNESHIFVHLACQSSTVRHVTSRLIGCLAQRMESFFVNRILCRLVDSLTSETSSIYLQLGCAEVIFGILAAVGRPPPQGFLHLVTLPLLVRMNHRNECLRCISATCFGTVVKLLPLQCKFDSSVNTLKFEDKIQDRIDKVEELMALLSHPSSIIKNWQQLRHEPKIGLRAYQKEGVAWLMFLHRYRLGGLLGDDMGLGKTLQTLCCLVNCSSLETSVTTQPSLIVCPKTLVRHWLQETENYFSPSSVLAINLDNLQQVGNFQSNASNFSSCTLYVTSYDFLRRQMDFFAQQQWFYCVLDEGHVIRNEKTATSQAVMQLKSQHRIVLSGTPVQNNVLELWALFEFLMPGYLGEKKRFNRLYGRVTAANARENGDEKADEASAGALDALHKLVLPFILRRRKTDVLADLPPKIVQDVLCELSPLQALLYRDFVDQFERRRIETKKPAGQGSTLQVLAYLRKLCDHPCLVLDHSKLDLVNGVKSQYDVEHVEDYKLSAKMVALKQLLFECGIGDDDGIVAKNSMPQSAEAHRALIFCQFTSVISLIGRYFDSKVFGSHVTFLAMDGSTPVESRQKIVDRFNADPTVDVLLLTTAVGGLGLNLTGADVVIFVDHDWNPCKDLQAMDRAHRLGQRRTVNVYRLICKDSLEEKMMRYQKFKTDTSNAVMSHENSSLKSMATDHLLDLLQDSVCMQGKKTASSKHQNLPELWDQSQYEDSFDVKSFLSEISTSGGITS